MKNKIVVALVILTFLLSACLERIYVLDFGAASYKRVSCDSFKYYPELEKVECDGETFYGVKDVGFE